MNRREWLATMAALPLEKKARLRPALCAYSFRSELQNKSMTYEDLVARAVEWEIDGLDLTVYWLPTTDRAWLLELRRKAFRMGVEIFSISVRTELTRAAPQGATPRWRRSGSGWMWPPLSAPATYACLAAACPKARRKTRPRRGWSNA